MALVAFGLGANVDDPLARLVAAVEALAGFTSSLRLGPLVCSTPVSPVPQPDFLNSVALAEASLDPHALLGRIKLLEREAGRRPGPRWGPRPLDVDLLLYDQLVLRSDDLELPHPRLRQRGFVLVPLAALEPALPIPPDGITAAELAASVDTSDLVPQRWPRTVRRWRPEP